MRKSFCDKVLSLPSSSCFTLLCTFFFVISASAESQVKPSGAIKSVGDIAFVYVKIPNHFNLKIVAPKPFLISEMSSRIDCNGVAITGGFFDENDRHDGLIVISGSEVSPVKKIQEGGVVSVNDSQVDIYRIGDFLKRAPSGDFQIQSPQILIIDGKIDPLDNRKEASRVALGRLKSGELVMIAAFSVDWEARLGITLRSFAAEAQALFGGRLDWLVNFDGGPNAFLYTPERSFATLSGTVFSYLCAEAKK